MKYLLLFSLLIPSVFVSAQIDDYHRIELNKGSKFVGKIVGETSREYLLQTNLNDTFYIKRSAVKRILVIQDNHNAKGDVPILTQGLYKNFFFGVGSGSRVTNPQWGDVNLLSFMFPPFRTTSAPVPLPQSTLLSVYKGSFTVGYQFNRRFGLGVGLNIDALAQDEFLPGNVLFERANWNPYLQGKFNYPIPNWGNKDLWLTVNVFRHTEIIAGLSFYAGEDVFNVGLGWYKSYFAFKTENYFSLQAGLQF